jgi:hypothetical protein
LIVIVFEEDDDTWEEDNSKIHASGKFMTINVGWTHYG